MAAAACSLSLQASLGAFDAALALCELLGAPEEEGSRAASARSARPSPPAEVGLLSAASDGFAGAEAAALRAALHRRFAHALFAEGAFPAAMQHFARSDAPPLQARARPTP